MKSVAFERRVPFTPEQMFDLVADLDAYPRFVPNCADMSLTDMPGGDRLARMTVSFGPVQLAYTSRVRLDRAAGSIAAHAADGPFSALDSEWRFEPDGTGSRVRFAVAYEFANPLVAVVAEPAFAGKQEEIVEAFLAEAARRYG